MDPKLKAEWVAALRSGKYQQGTGELRSKHDEFCCLGVLCDLIRPHGWKESPQGTYYVMTGSELWESFVLPKDVAEQVGLTPLGLWPSGAPQELQEFEGLADMNDAGKSFYEIADAIEKYF